MNWFPTMLCAAGVLTACGGGGGSPATPPPPSAVTITAPMEYLAQSRGTNGDALTLLRADDPMIYRRFDFGRHQASDSFLAADGSAITTWSYAPFGPFNAALGDGGEQYVLRGDAVYIASTQDGGQAGVQQFGDKWWLFDTRIPDCSAGWRSNGLGRACHAVITFPGGISVDTIVSEHYDQPNLGGKMERIYLGRGFGRLAWQAWGPGCFRRAGDLDARSPAISFDGPPAEHPDWVRCDTRINTNIEPADGTLTGAMLWHP